MTLDWQRAKSDFNHAWLKNRLVVGLMKCLRVHSGQVEDRHAGDALARLIAEWREMRGAACSLLDFIEQRTAKPIPPSPHDVSMFGVDTAAFLLEVERQRWLSHSSVNDSASEARREIEDLDRALSTLSSALTSRGNTFQTLIEDCLDAGRRLAERFSRLTVPRDFIIG